MLWTLFLILLAGWSLGVISGDLFDGSLHLLLLGAVLILFLETITSGRSPQT